MEGEASVLTVIPPKVGIQLNLSTVTLPAIVDDRLRGHDVGVGLPRQARADGRLAEGESAAQKKKGCRSRQPFERPADASGD